MAEITKLQEIYLQQVWSTLEKVTAAYDEAFILRAKSHENSAEKREADAMAKDLERWQKYLNSYWAFARKEPNKMFTH